MDVLRQSPATMVRFHIRFFGEVDQQLVTWRTHTPFFVDLLCDVVDGCGVCFVCHVVLLCSKGDDWRLDGDHQTRDVLKRLLGDSDKP